VGRGQSHRQRALGSLDGPGVVDHRREQMELHAD
ncbi:MAG: hypothetical protein AVDCRST_MAG57-2332, partial [uncultured Blastococcus sp.]